MACFMVAMSTTLTVKPEPMGYSEQSRQELNDLVARSQGYAVYDSRTRAEQIADLWNVSDLADAEAALALLDRKRFLEGGR
jgi:hypothetical protein